MTSDNAARIRSGQLSETEVLQLLRHLSEGRQLADVEYVRCCLAFEDSELWRNHSAMRDRTFAHYLRRNGCRVDARYRKIEKVLRNPKLEPLVDELGICACLKIAETPKKHHKELVRQYREFVEKEGKVVPQRMASSLHQRVTGTRSETRQQRVLRESHETTREVLQSVQVRLQSRESLLQVVQRLLGVDSIEEIEPAIRLLLEERAENKRLRRILKQRPPSSRTR